MNYNVNNNWSNQYIRRGTSSKYHPKRQRKTIILLIIILLVIIIFLMKCFSTDSNNVEASNDNGQSNQVLDAWKEGTESSKEESNTIVIDLNNDTKDDTIEVNNKNQYDYSKPVPASKRVNLDYFEDAVFIGDSRTEGFILNNGLIADTNSYTSKGLNVSTIFSDKIINIDGKKITIMEALEKTSFSKVYIMLGINETGWVYSNLFIKKYGEIIDEIRKINPNCTIYIQSILPVSQEVSDEHSYIKNSKIDEYNSLIEKMANEKKVYYINVKEAVVNENDVLPEDAATDGIHLNKKYCEKWLEYLKNHIVEE